MVLHTLKSRGVHERTAQFKVVTRAGTIAAVALTLVYIGLGMIGRNTFAAIGKVDGPTLLQHYANTAFGSIGLAVLGLAILLACLTTSVGLVTAFAEYMMTLSARITLKTASIFTTVLGLTVSIVGLQTLLSIAVPVLMFLYPIVIVLIALTFMRHLFRRKSVVYQSTLGVTIFFSLCSALNQLSLFPGNLKTFYQSLPLVDQSLEWLFPTLIAFGISSWFGHVSTASVTQKRAS